MLVFCCHVVKSDLNLRINTNCTFIWYLIICPLLHLFYGSNGHSFIRIDLWQEKRIWEYLRRIFSSSQRKASTVLEVLPNSHIMSVRICIQLLYRKQMEAEASLHSSACVQHADKGLMWKPARTYKRIKNFESKAVRKKTILVMLSYSFWINLEAMKGTELTDQIPFLIHKTGAVNGDFWALPTVPVHFSLG